MNNIEDALQAIQERIARACHRAGRPETSVKLVAASKGVAAERIKDAFDCGLRDFGENYVQEAQQKQGVLEKTGITWHMFGNIQTRKIKTIPRLFSWVHSVDRWELLEGLDKGGAKIRALFEVNLSGEESKHGMNTETLKEILEKMGTIEHVEPVGLMTMPPFADDPEASRPIFGRLRELLHEANREFRLDMRELSMGMSGDFEVAIEEGATMVRIGTALFGGRQ